MFKRGDRVVRLKKHQSLTYWRQEVCGEENMGKVFVVGCVDRPGNIRLKGLSGSYNENRFELVLEAKPLTEYM